MFIIFIISFHLSVFPVFFNIGKKAKSGTGKTVVFAVVILEAINVKRPTIQAIVLSPTREIAFQSQMVIERLASHIPGLKCHLFVGGKYIYIYAVMYWLLSSNIHGFITVEHGNRFVKCIFFTEILLVF